MEIESNFTLNKVMLQVYARKRLKCLWWRFRDIQIRLLNKKSKNVATPISLFKVS